MCITNDTLSVLLAQIYEHFVNKNFSVLTFMNIDILIVLINLFSVGLLKVTVMELVCNSDIGLFALKHAIVKQQRRSTMCSVADTGVRRGQKRRPCMNKEKTGNNHVQ